MIGRKHAIISHVHLLGSLLIKRREPTLVYCMYSKLRRNKILQTYFHCKQPRHWEFFRTKLSSVELGSRGHHSSCQIFMQVLSVLTCLRMCRDVVIFQPPRLHSKLEESQIKYTEDATLHKLKSWLVDNVQGLVGHRTRSNEAQFKRPLVIAYYDVDYVKNAKGTNYWRNRYVAVTQLLIWLVL